MLLYLLEYLFSENLAHGKVKVLTCKSFNR